MMMKSRRFTPGLAKSLCLAVFGFLAANGLAHAADKPNSEKPRNVIIFVADGLRYGIVNHDTAPTLADIQKNGVDFRNSHSVYPTVTTANASAIATGHGIGDTGEWSNAIVLPPLKSEPGAVHFMESDLILKETNGLYGNNYFNEMSLLALARQNHYQTAAIGKEGPILIQDISASDGASTIFIDDSTGTHFEKNHAIPLDPSIVQAMKDAGVETVARDRGLNQSAGAYNLPGVMVANIYQQQWFTDVTTKVILPRFVASSQPFALVYWSRDPDGTQHNTGDSLNTLSPGINGPTSLAAVRNASDNLQALIDTLKALGVYDNTDIFVTADHGFSTISRQSKTSWAAKQSYPDDTVKGFLPEGFLALDLARELKLPVFDAYNAPINVAHGDHPRNSASIGADPAHPDITVAESGGSDLIYLDPAKAKDLTPQIIAALTKQDYVAGLFVDDELGPIPGALPMSAVGLRGAALTPRPAIYVSFSDYALPSCLKKWLQPELCSVMVTDTNLQQGQGNHGGFTRANTRNFMAAIGPDFKTGYADLAPVSNADITPTLAHILGFDLPAKGALKGRAINEAPVNGPAAIDSTSQVIRSSPAANGFVTVLESQTVGEETYLDAAGMPGRVVGLKTAK